MAAFEEQFKTKAQSAPVDPGTLKMKLAQKTPSKVSLMEPNRAKNLAITLRKEGMAASDICCAIETYELRLHVFTLPCSGGPVERVNRDKMHRIR